MTGCSQKDELQVLNQAPLAQNQTKELLGNATTEIRLKGSDPDNDPITYKLISSPQYGLLSGELPNLVYTPNEDLDRVDQFEFLVNDGKLDSEPALVKIVITQFNAAPTASTDTYSTVGACRLVIPAAQGVLNNDRDSDGDDLFAVIEAETTNGTLTLEADGSFVYIPSLPLSPMDSFRYRVSDGITESTSTEVNIEIDNDGIIVTTIDDISEADEQCSLREAFEMANTGLAVDACATTNSNKRILFGVSEGRFSLDLNAVVNEPETEVEIPNDDDGNQRGDLDLKSEVTLMGCGYNNTIIDGNARTRLFHVLPGALFRAQNLSINNGSTHSSGSAIYNEGSTHLIGVSFQNNHTTGLSGDNGGTTGGGGGGGGAGSFGGAIYNHTDATLTIEGTDSLPCLFHGNSVTGGRGGNGLPNGSVGQGRGGDGAGPLAGLGTENDGLPGGFGSGGGGGGGTWQGTTFGGLGGFAGGGGGAGARTGGNSGQEGALSIFAGGKGGKGGCSAAPGGGGGGGLGGAIFNHEGIVTIDQCRFENNSAIGGPRGSNVYCGVQPGAGLGYGGAIFNYGGIINASNLVYTDNIADDSPNLHDYSASEGDEN